MDFTQPFFIEKNRLPWEFLFTNAVMFFTVNMMNNWAFDFKISVPVHIILRSGGSVVTMVVGWLLGKKYSRMQALSVALLTAGVVTAAFADAHAKVLTLFHNFRSSLAIKFLTYMRVINFLYQANYIYLSTCRAKIL